MEHLIGLGECYIGCVAALHGCHAGSQCCLILHGKLLYDVDGGNLHVQVSLFLYAEADVLTLFNVRK